MKFNRLTDEELLSSRKREAQNGGVPTKFVEHRNFMKLGARLTDYGFIVQQLPVDDEGADFVAIHVKSGEVLKVQLKAYITTAEKYYGKDLYIAFPRDNQFPLNSWVIVPHDRLSELYPFEQNKHKSNYQRKVSEKIWQEVAELSVVDELLDL